MIQIELFQFFGGGWQDILPVEPADEVRVLIEPIFLHKFVNNHATGRQAMKTIVLVVFISEFVHSHDLSANGLVLLLDVPLTPLRSLASD